MPVPITRAGVSLCYVAQSTTGDTDLALGFRLGAFSHASVSYNLKTLLYKDKLSQSGKAENFIIPRRIDTSPFCGLSSRGCEHSTFVHRRADSPRSRRNLLLGKLEASQGLRLSFFDVLCFGMCIAL